MFALYPSNKLEHLSVLLSGLLSAQPSAIFEQDYILVESPGMQHWLNLNLAAQTGISMNLHFPLTTRFVWDIARTVLGDEAIPTHSPYRREVLRFRILQLLNDTESMAQAAMQGLQDFWLSSDNQNSAAVKKLNLAIEIADAFEQYILFRPQWLQAWEQGRQPQELQNNAVAQWQAVLWRYLVAQQPWHPANLLAQTSDKLNVLAAQKNGLANIPSRIIVFAVNALAPSLLHFFDALAKHCDIHFFYLNPSVNYWGDLRSDSSHALMLRKQRFTQSLEQEQGNRLLANLGQHGRDLLNRLSELQSFEISAFEAPIPDSSTTNSALSRLQTSIYEGVAIDAIPKLREADSSIRIVSCHTALRELQVLHDHLITRMSDESDLFGRDIIVLCPAIEDYAPYIYSVFAKPEENSSSKISCSISDRSALTTNPHIVAFMAVMSLPDSRFQVSSILALLNNPDIAKQFNIDSTHTDVLAQWLNKAAVRWGLNAENKNTTANIVNASAQNSWEWGLERLLMGITATDSECLIDDLLTVPEVEGLDTLLFGNLLRFIVYLQQTQKQLRRPRTVDSWVQFLQQQCTQLFHASANQSRGVDTIQQAVLELNLHTQQAGFNQTLTYQEVKELLTRAFSTPDVRNQFLTGHVTFCSMMPMRSVPFNTVAVLGLNDGQFPRKTQQQSINIMSMLPAAAGDRSRSREDRYLFLEALLSARKALYLSYQGASSRDNTERQPSTVLSLLLQELIYLHPEIAQVTQYPLHHFAKQNYQPPLQSANHGGYRLATRIIGAHQPDEEQTPFQPYFSTASVAEKFGEQWNTVTIAQCFQNPLAFFAQQQLNVNLTTPEQTYDDDEPFAIDSLVQYNALDEALHNPDETAFNELFVRLRLSGTMPDSGVVQNVYEHWQQGMASLQQALPDGYHQANNNHYVAHVANATLATQARQLHTILCDVHVGSQTAKRKMQQWLRHLVVNSTADTPIDSHIYYLDLRTTNQVRNAGEVRCTRINGLAADVAMQHLNVLYKAFMQSLAEPCLYHARMGEAICRAKIDPENTWHTHIQGTEQLAGLNQDPYFKWLVQIQPSWSQWQEPLTNVYAPMVAAMKDAKVK